MRCTFDDLEKSLVESGGSVVSKLADQDATGSSFHERQNAMLASVSCDGIHLPVPELATVFDRGRSL